MGVEYSGTHAKPRLELGVAVMEYVEQAKEFIGSVCLPIFKTKKKESSFSAITRESITRDADTKRAPRSAYNRDGFEAKDLSYKCEEHGLEGALDDGEREMYASDFDAELITSQITARRLMQAQERRVAELLFNISTWTGADLYTDHSANPWDDIASDVIGQIRAAREKVRSNCGIDPNALICNKANIDRLLDNTGIKDSIKYVARLTEAEILNALADILGLKKIVVGKAIYNSAKEGQTFVSADIWNDDYAMVGVVAEDGQNLIQPSVGRTFLWVSDSPDNATVESYRDEKHRSDIFRVRQNVDEKVIDKYFAHLLKVDA